MLVHSYMIEISIVHIDWLTVLTLQTYKQWSSLEVGQKLFTENCFHLIIEECWITMLILQLHHNIMPELVILSEHGYHRN